MLPTSSSAVEWAAARRLSCAARRDETAISPGVTPLKAAMSFSMSMSEIVRMARSIAAARRRSVSTSAARRAPVHRNWQH